MCWAEMDSRRLLLTERVLQDSSATYLDSWECFHYWNVDMAWVPFILTSFMPWFPKEEKAETWARNRIWTSSRSWQSGKGWEELRRALMQSVCLACCTLSCKILHNPLQISDEFWPRGFKKVVGPEIHLHESWKSTSSFQPEFLNGCLIPLCSYARSLSLSLESSFPFLVFILQLYLQRVTVSPLRLGSTWLNKPLSFNFLL